MSAAEEGADILQMVGKMMLERDREYGSSDKLYANVMAALFPTGIVLAHDQDHHRFHIFMLMIVKVTRYVRNWPKGHEDSLRDLAAYAGMLAAIDRDIRRKAG